MKKGICGLLVLAVAVFLVVPVPGEAQGPGGHHGGGNHHEGGDHWGIWAPLAIIGGAAALYFFSRPYYSYENDQIPVVIQDRSTNAQPTPTDKQALTDKLFMYPRSGQSAEQQAKDRYECHDWAVRQTAFDPTKDRPSVGEARLNQLRADYQRAMGACLDARGYSVR